MRIVVASEEQVARAAIGKLIASQSDFELAGEAANISDLLLSVNSKRPDLVVLDCDVRGEQIDTLQELVARVAEPPLIIDLSVHEKGPRHRVRLRRCGLCLQESSTVSSAEHDS